MPQGIAIPRGVQVVVQHTTINMVSALVVSTELLLGKLILLLVCLKAVMGIVLAVLHTNRQQAMLMPMRHKRQE